MGERTDDVVAYAKRRYFEDAEFHARVEVAVQLLAKAHPVSLTDQERSLATTAAAIGLAMQWVDPMTGRIFDD
jgi:hypothetical protein